MIDYDASPEDIQRRFALQHRWVGLGKLLGGHPTRRL